jgi:cation diffusion facilitator CzcD-associated flavoprotein CzcO
MSAQVDFIVVGSGFSGIGAGVRLQRERRSFVILEKADSVGGTWRENTYPGCACDVPSHLYSFSFEPRPSWSRVFAPQPEIRAYLEHCAEKYGLTPHLRFGREVTRARFDEREHVWRVETGTGETFVGRYLILGLGALHRPSVPKIPGLERFSGKTFHSAQWDHGYDLAGKRVAVIGTGASAIQFVPHVQARARELTLFQRSPPWVLPKLDGEIAPDRQRFFADHPFAQRLARYGTYAVMETFTAGFTFAPAILRLAERLARDHLAKQVADEALRQKLTPAYRAGCKRILLSNDYYPALAQPNVQVVTDAIVSVGERFVVTARGEHPVDAIIFGTGFAATALLTPLSIYGRDARDINEAWQDGIAAYLGMAVAGFPNAFMLFGPNTTLASNSMVFMIEAQIDFILQCARAAEARGAASVEVRGDAEATHNRRLQRRLADSVWASGCQSWYLDAHGKNPVSWPGSTVEYWARTRRMAVADFVFAGSVRT